VCFTQESMDFQEKILRTSCIGEQSLFPPAIMAAEYNLKAGKKDHTALSMAGAREEASLMMFNAVEQLLEKTGTKAEDVGVLVVNCSLFCPPPTHSAMINHRFGLRSDVLSYNLGGMGCSASVIAVDLANRLLQGSGQRNSVALVVSTENITQNWYRGNEKSMLLSNCLFRCGAAAMLLSNRRSDRSRARFRLLHTVRTHLGQKDDCYSCVFQEEDQVGIVGVRLDKKIMQIAGDALKSNVTSLGPLVLPLSEQFLFIMNLVARRAASGKVPLPSPLRKLCRGIALLLIPLPGIRWLVGYVATKEGDAGEAAKESGKETAKEKGKENGKDVANGKDNGKAAAKENGKENGKTNGKTGGKDKGAIEGLAGEVPTYLPNFTKAFEWICVHTGGRAVIDAIENNLSLPSHMLEPSRLSLYRYGNVSSASIWYELELIAEYGNMCGAQREGGVCPAGAPRRLRRGDRIWQIAFGSGFKCNSAVWQCLRNH